MPGRVFVIQAVAFLFGLQLLTIFADIEILAWSPRGYNRGFFGNYAWIRSKHIGEFWRNWNQQAIVAFQELTAVTGLRRHHFLNTFIIFLVSGVIHQVCMFYYTRALSYGTLLSFLLHGLAVYLFARLSRRRRRMPRPVALALFNPITSALVTLTLSQPFVMDLYGAFKIPLF
jgi:hypothetical protein